MSTSLLFELLVIRNKISSPEDFEFYEILLYKERLIVNTFLSINCGTQKNGLIEMVFAFPQHILKE